MAQAGRSAEGTVGTQPAASTPVVPPPVAASTPVVSPPAAASAPTERQPTSVGTQPATSIPPDSELLPLTPMRRAIAEHMVRSVRTAPHVTSFVEVDLSQVIAHREAHKASFAQQGVRLTFTPYFFQATATALRKVPVLNGSFSEEGILLNKRIHIGMAVALDEGLLVPVLRDVEEKNLLGLSRAVNDLAERARTRKLKPDETQGGTFTITNHGVGGSLFATPIINQPQAGILGIGAIVKRPVVISLAGSDAITIRPLCYLSLTFDHRIADGATADLFLATVKEQLEGVRE
jgi:2-oxoisovalerate dehydrogenase E2 component (dihydrolipoyl transacylase)